jgi:methionyl-tRNA formyltransferase
VTVDGGPTRIVFAGTPAFASSALRAILDAGHDVALVLTQPDRPAGRGLKPRPSEVKALALERGLAVAQPATLRSPDSQALLQAAKAPLMVVAAYGLILPQAVLDAFQLGCINIHASLLPRWRGAAPIQRAILAGDAETGICIMRMDAGLDTGPVYLSESIPIASDDTAGSLHNKLATLGGCCIVRALPAIASGKLEARPQPSEGITYARKIEKSEALINWSCSAQEIDTQVRAFNPVPVASTTLRGEPLRIWRARAMLSEGDRPGRVVDAGSSGILVTCGRGSLLITELQRAGGKRLAAVDFMHGFVFVDGEVLGA